MALATPCRTWKSALYPFFFTTTSAEFAANSSHSLGSSTKSVAFRNSSSRHQSTKGSETHEARMHVFFVNVFLLKFLYITQCARIPLAFASCSFHCQVHLYIKTSISRKSYMCDARRLSYLFIFGQVHQSCLNQTLHANTFLLRE